MSEFYQKCVPTYLQNDLTENTFPRKGFNATSNF